MTKGTTELAGVSESTISRVLGNNGHISNEARQKIEKVIKEHQYKPSAVAVSLSKQESSIIDVVIPEIDNPLFTEMLKGITEMTDENGFSLIFCDTQNSSEKKLEALGMLEQQRVRGTIITPAVGYGLESISKIKAALSKLAVPIVVVDRDFDYSEQDAVYFQNYESGYLTAESLIKAGNERIGIILGDMQLKITKERYRDFKDAMASYHKVICDKDVWKGDFTTDTAYDLMKQMVASGDLPNAMVTTNNRTSMGSLKAMVRAGITVGKGVAVVGVDLIPTLDTLGFHFSCVSRDTEEMGRIAMRLLMCRMAEPDSNRNIWVVPCKLGLKGSESKRR